MACPCTASAARGVAQDGNNGSGLCCTWSEETVVQITVNQHTSLLLVAHLVSFVCFFLLFSSFFFFHDRAFFRDFRSTS